MDCTLTRCAHPAKPAGTRLVAGLAAKLKHPSSMLARLLLCLALIPSAMASAAMELPSPIGAVPFDHRAHAAREGANCAVCHHTSTGTDVAVACRQCHQPSAGFAPDRRDAFHGSCIGCHDTLQRTKKTTGPVKRCSGCHTPKK